MLGHQRTSSIRVDLGTSGLIQSQWSNSHRPTFKNNNWLVVFGQASEKWWSISQLGCLTATQYFWENAKLMATQTTNQKSYQPKIRHLWSCQSYLFFHLDTPKNNKKNPRKIPGKTHPFSMFGTAKKTSWKAIGRSTIAWVNLLRISVITCNISKYIYIYTLIANTVKFVGFNVKPGVWKVNPMSWIMAIFGII